MSRQTLKVPDIGGAEDAEVIEVCVARGDVLALDQSLIVLESDKASMEIPAEQAGTVLEVLVKEGQKLAEGSPILVLESQAEAEASSVAEPAPESESAPAPVTEPTPALVVESAPEPEPAPEPAPEEMEPAPESESAPVTEPTPAPVVESAPEPEPAPEPAPEEMEPAPESAPAPVTKPTPAPVVEFAPEPEPAPEPAPEEMEPAPESAPAPATAAQPAVSAPVASRPGGAALYAGPAVRKLAREFGVDLAKVLGSGPGGRILKEDLQEFVKQSLVESAAPPAAGIPPAPRVDFAAFGEVSVQPMSRIEQLTAANMHRSWLNVPRVTQFDEVDITELENFRACLKAEGERRGVSLSLLPFLLKACAAALQDHPKLNASLGADGESLVYRKYVHIGMAVDTPAGLMAPVLRDVDRKNLWELAEICAVLAGKARERKLGIDEMQGAGFTISSLGKLGGTGFTPIINTPESAILGVARMALKPHWNGTEFEPRKMLPLTLAYDHRVINGADAGRFVAQLRDSLTDIRKLLL